MLRFLRCYSLHFTRHSELLRGSLTANSSRAIKKPLINSTYAANCCVMRYSEYSHILKYIVFAVLLLLALYSL